MLYVCVWTGNGRREESGEGVQRGVLREDTRGRVSARLCRLALTATDAGLKWESSWAACLPIQQENKSHVEEPLCGITDSRLTPQISRGEAKGAGTTASTPPPHPPCPGSNVTLPVCQPWILKFHSWAPELSHCFTKVLGNFLHQCLDKALKAWESL